MKYLFTLLLSPVVLCAQDQSTLPAGNGKELVEASCAQCHSLNLIASAGHSLEQWRTVVDMMINAGAELPRDRAPAVTEYLAKNFPPKGQPSAVIIPGPIK